MALTLVESVRALNRSVADLRLRNTSTVVASKLGLGTGTRCAATFRVRLVRIVAAVIFRVAHPPTRNALSGGCASKVAQFVTHRTPRNNFVRAVATIVLTVTKRPFGNATI